MSAADGLGAALCIVSLNEDGSVLISRKMACGIESVIDMRNVPLPFREI